jgi:hypothetical protein
MFSISTSTARTLLCPCQNGGVCSMLGSQTCVCPNGFTGRFCERLLRKYDEFSFQQEEHTETQLCNDIMCRNGEIFRTRIIFNVNVLMKFL